MFLHVCEKCIARVVVLLMLKNDVFGRIVRHVSKLTFAKDFKK